MRDPIQKPLSPGQLPGYSFLALGSSIHRSPRAVDRRPSTAGSPYGTANIVLRLMIMGTLALVVLYTFLLYLTTRFEGCFSILKILS